MNLQYKFHRLRHHRLVYYSSIIVLLVVRPAWDAFTGGGGIKAGSFTLNNILLPCSEKSAFSLTDNSLKDKQLC